MPSLKLLARDIKQYTMIAAGSLGLTGGRAPVGPVQAQIGISDPCNHECVFCWDHPPKARASSDTAQRFGLARPGVMPLEQFQSIVDDLHKLGTRRIDLIGRGEPLLNRHVVDMIRYVKSRDMYLLICTNAARLSRQIAKDIVSLGVNRINISLNAGTPATYPQIHVTESPEDYIKVKNNLRFLADCKIAAGSDLPLITPSFVISSKNYFEILEMIEVVHEIGGQEAQFLHTTTHEGTTDLGLNGEQYRELLASLPAAREKAAMLGVTNNLEAFAASIPAYMASETVGPPIVPCYVGWYFTVVLGNGSVMPCCQCATPIGQVSAEQSFADIWAAPAYGEFRAAARTLPKQSEKLMSCECNNCALRPRNLAIHNMLHPLGKIQAGPEVAFYSRGLRARLQGKRSIR